MNGVTFIEFVPTLSINVQAFIDNVGTFVDIVEAFVMNRVYVR
jgi:hypothetical protein